MRSLADLAGRWVALDGEDRVVACGESPDVVRRRAASSVGEPGTLVAWISPHPPHVALPHWPLTMVRSLTETELWLAGGPVRDLLLGRWPKDWDFVLAERALDLARDVANAMGGAFYVLDADRGTGRAIVRDPRTGHSIALDFAAFRGKTLQDDLCLRDFTINAMALTLDGELIDPTGGRADLCSERVDLTHPDAMRHDPVRLLRAPRIAMELGFKLTARVTKQSRSAAPMIRNVAAERIRDELVKLLKTPEAHRGVEQLADLGLLSHVLPEAGLSYPHGSGAEPEPAQLARRATRLRVTGQLVRSVEGVEGEPHGPSHLAAQWAALATFIRKYQVQLDQYFSQDLGAGLTRRHLMPWAALLLGDGHSAETSHHAAERVQRRLTELRFPVRAQSFVATAVRESWRFGDLQSSVRVEEPERRLALYRYFQTTDDVGVAAALLSLIDEWVDPPALPARLSLCSQLETLSAVLSAYFLQREEIVAPTPLLDGNDLLEMGFTQGPALGRTLEALREAQVTGQVKTKAEARTWLSVGAAQG